MAITNLTVSNFKSFKHLDLKLGRFNVVIGANASGKSNFVEIFKFLKTLERENLDDAVSLHGGATALTNLRLGCGHPLEMSIASDQQDTWAGWEATEVYETMYGFSLQIGSPQDRIVIKDDRFTQRFQAAIGDEGVEVTLGIVMSEGMRKAVMSPSDVLERIKEKGKLSSFLTIQKLFKLVQAKTVDALLLHHGFSGLLGFLGLSDILLPDIGVYDIDPRAVKRPHEIAGITRLEENGENLALVLKHVLADPEKSRKFHNLLRYMLPFAMEVGTEQYLGESVLLKLREEYYKDGLLANLLSDGTVDVVALITALFFEDKDVVIIEEPERNVHPRIISGLLELMKDASRNKQIIVTTHSPEVVKHAGLENLLLISRDKEGFSTISRPAEKEAVKIFLQHDLGLDDLFVQDLLAVP